MSQQRISIAQAMELAAQHAEQGNHDTARKLYSQVLRLQPDNAAVQKALSELPAGSGESSFSIDMRRLLGLYNAGQFSDAEEMARDLTGQYPGQPMPSNILGAILVRRGLFNEGVDAIRRALEIAPEYAEAWSNLGNAQLESGDAAGAVSSYQRALELEQSPGLIAAASRGLGKALATQGKEPEAITAFEQALKHDPTDTAARTGLAMALHNEGKFQAAVVQLEKVLERNPGSALAHLILGRSLDRLGRYEEAITHVEQAIVLEPGNAGTYLRLGRFYTKVGNMTRAAQAYRNSLELEPDNPEVRHLLDAAEGNTTSIAPREYIEDYFDSFSSTFEENLVDTLGYCSPEVLSDLLRSSMAEGQKFSAVIDLGCGTGLMGEKLRDIATDIVGVDLSEKMLELARDKGVYSDLIQGDIVAALEASEKTYDLVISADVLVYIGDLLPLMQTVAKKSGAGHLLVISTELLEGPGDYELLATGRYAHSKDYVTRVAASAGLSLKKFESSPLRKEGGRWLTGGYYLFGNE